MNATKSKKTAKVVRAVKHTCGHTDTSKYNRDALAGTLAWLATIPCRECLAKRTK